MFPRNLTSVAPGTLGVSRLKSQALGMCCGATRLLAWALGDLAECGEEPGAGVWNCLSLPLVLVTDKFVV